uniref:Uncharacterized protein n=1 Tax=Anguilla anguilla TaxID=7936 RepID=A0A0E9U507_ANGAN
MKQNDFFVKFYRRTGFFSQCIYPMCYLYKRTNV